MSARTRGTSYGYGPTPFWSLSLRANAETIALKAAVAGRQTSLTTIYALSFNSCSLRGVFQ